MIFFVIVVVVGVVVYRVVVFVFLSGSFDKLVQKCVRLIILVIVVFFNFLVINFLKFFYSKLVVWLIDWENLLICIDYEDSFMWKMYMFQFVNMYVFIFYIVFFKFGFVVGILGRYNRISGNYWLDGCSE